MEKKKKILGSWWDIIIAMLIALFGTIIISQIPGQLYAMDLVGFKLEGVGLLTTIIIAFVALFVVFFWALDKKRQTDLIEREVVIKETAVDDKKSEQIKREKEEKNKAESVYNYMYTETKKSGADKLTVGYPKDGRWFTAKEIATNVNLTEDEVKEICAHDERIRPHSKADEWGSPIKFESEERYAIREFVDNLQPFT